MVLWTLIYNIDECKREEYLQFSKNEAVPHWTSLPGLVEMRSYTESGSTKVLVELEFESYEAWGKAMDDPKTKLIREKFAKYTYDYEWTLWSTSTVYPKPIKPKK